MAKVGDIVRYLNSVGGGKIVRIKDNMAYVDEDGFETPVLLRECVVVTTAETQRAAVAERLVITPAPVATKEVVKEPEEPFEETPGGDRLNIVLGYEPANIKNLSGTSFDTYLVNDSNYYIYFSYLSRDEGAADWTTRYAGVVEPGIQLFLEELQRDDLSRMSRIAVQCIAFKRERSFELMAPVNVNLRFDATKFFKLHCFRPNEYFDRDVIAYEIVKNGEPMTQVAIDPIAVEKSMRTKIAADRRPVKKRNVQKHQDTVVTDLHIDELVDTKAGLSNADMLNLQVDEFRRVMDANLKNHGQKLVFIHGKGEGVLRQAIMKELNHRYKGHDVQDASFREYGFGATQVTIR